MQKVTFKDYLAGAGAGFVVGLCVIPVLQNSDYHNVGVFTAIPFVVAVCWIIGLWLGKVLSRFWSIMLQLAKFVEVGFLNTALNFGLLNILSLMTGVTKGVGAGSINVPGTILAAANSYCWNKLWVFKQRDDGAPFLADVPKFALVTGIAIVINSSIIALFTYYIPPVLGLNKGAWLNVGKVVATVGSMVINFVGYKFLVFVKNKA